MNSFMVKKFNLGTYRDTYNYPVNRLRHPIRLGFGSVTLILQYFKFVGVLYWANYRKSEDEQPQTENDKDNEPYAIANI